MNAKIKKLMERREALERAIAEEQQAERERRIQSLVSVADRHGLLNVEAARLGSIITRVARQIEAEGREVQGADRAGEAVGSDAQEVGQGGVGEVQQHHG
jgi:hypothetical protein